LTPILHLYFVMISSKVFSD